MRLVSSIILFCLSAALVNAEPSRIVINVERSDFKPLQEVSWRIMAGSVGMTRNQDNYSFSGSGLSISADKMFSPKWSAGMNFSNVSGIQSESLDDVSSGTREIRTNFYTFTGYAKYSFINFPVNQWNLIQMHLLGGVSVYDKYSNSVQPVYGASAEYNYDNLIGFELGTRVNLKAEASTNLNLIGYF
jgi:hypothetical protein